MMPAITRPMMSSNKAAHTRTQPTLVRLKSAPDELEAKSANVVPNDVEHSAAPLANACRPVYPYAPIPSPMLRAIGTSTPVNAAKVLKPALFRMSLSDAASRDTPASNMSRSRPIYPMSIKVRWLDVERMELDVMEGPKRAPSKSGRMRVSAAFRVYDWDCVSLGSLGAESATPFSSSSGWG